MTSTSVSLRYIKRGTVFISILHPITSRQAVRCVFETFTRKANLLVFVVVVVVGEYHPHLSEYTL